MATQQGQERGIDPQFGFTATSMDVEPPVTPDHEVQLLLKPREDAPIPEMYFEPVGLFVEPGDVVKFILATPEHTVSAYHPQFGRTQRVPDGVPAVSSPVLGAGTYWLYEFDTGGAYDLFCAPHEVFGMVTRIIVGSPSGPGSEPLEHGPSEPGDPRPPELTGALVLGDPALQPDAIVNQGQVSWGDIQSENKRLLIRIVEE